MNLKRVILLTLVLTIGIPFFVSASVIDECSEKIILIDPGHGGFDGGAKSKTGTVEASINLEISLKLKAELESKGYKVYLTRDEDKALDQTGKTIKEKKREDLKNRCKMKQETKCDIFISIHQNMFPQSKIYGAQVWHASNDNSMKLANLVQDEMKASINDGNKRVAKAAGEAYLILRDKYEGASILVECGFLSNPGEEAKLKTDEHQKCIINGIVSGVDKFFQEK